MQIRDMRELHPAVLPIAAEWLRRCAAHLYPVLVVETRRSWQVMEAYWARARKPLDEVNALYLLAGLAPITAEENLRTITNAEPGESWHFYGCAIDAVPIVNGKPDWKYDPENPADLYDEIAQEAKNLGFVWGKSFNDLPHIEYHPGWSVAAAVAWSRANSGDWQLPIPMPV